MEDRRTAVETAYFHDDLSRKCIEMENTQAGVIGGDSPWWQSPVPSRGSDKCAIAYYRHSAQGKQKNSIELQAEQVKTDAAARGLVIVDEFIDRGYSGLTANRPGFQALLNAVRTRKDFRYVMVLDVSRWGRFIDSNEFGRYEAECNQHDKKVVFVTQDFEAAGPAGRIGLEALRFLSAEESRNKSVKVFLGSMKVARQGYRAGAPAPYGLVRALYDERGEFVKFLRKGDGGKSVANERVKLAPGDPREVEVVGQIFAMFVGEGLDEKEIATRLNDRMVPPPSRGIWFSATIRKILRDRQYTGAIVYNRTSQKLRSRRRLNPVEEWVVTRGAFDAVVDEEVFQLAAARFGERGLRLKSDVMLSHLRRLYDRFGVVTGRMVEKDADSPTPRMYAKRFGSMTGAVQQLFAHVVRQAKAEIAGDMATVGECSEYDDFLVLDNRLTILIQPAIPIQSGYCRQWIFTPDPRPTIDITLGVALSGKTSRQILGYFPLPRLVHGGKAIRFTDSSDGSVVFHAELGLDLIRELLK